MPNALGEYFVREAGEYLAELERLLRDPTVPDAERLFRLARGVRGSAHVARADGVADVAARLEGAARYVLEGRIPWSEELRERATRTVADLQALLPASLRAWSEAEAARAREAAARWGGFADVARTPPSVPQGQPVFSFVRTELASMLEVLDRAIAALREVPTAEDPLREILSRLRTLRGVAGADPLAPVLEVLDGVDELARALITEPGTVEGERLEMLGAARDALQAALDALERDEAPPTTGEALSRFRALRDRVSGETAADADPTVVPIRDLFFEGAGPHIVESPVAPVGGDGQGEPPAAVVEFLQREATKLLDRAEAVLGGVADAESLPRVSRRLVDLASAVRELAASYGLAETAQAAASACAALHEASSIGEAKAALGRLRAALVPTEAPWEAPAAEPPEPAAAPAATPDFPPAEVDDAVVPIESLLLRGPRALEEALALRSEIERLLGAGAAAEPELRQRLDELWDLVAAGVDGDR